MTMARRKKNSSSNGVSRPRVYLEQFSDFFIDFFIVSSAVYIATSRVSCKGQTKPGTKAVFATALVSLH